MSKKTKGTCNCLTTAATQQVNKPRIGEMMQEFGQAFSKIAPVGAAFEMTAERALQFRYTRLRNALETRDVFTLAECALDAAYADRVFSFGNRVLMSLEVPSIPFALAALAEVWEFGRTKYEPGAWKNVSVEEYWNKAWRHAIGMWTEHTDLESDLPHSDSLLFNALALVHLIECVSGDGEDGRVS